MAPKVAGICRKLMFSEWLRVYQWVLPKFLKTSHLRQQNKKEM